MAINTDNVEFEALVEHGYLDLERLFCHHDVHKQEIEIIGSFVDEDGNCEIVLQKARRFGLIAYRWIGRLKGQDADNYWDTCSWQFNREAVIEDGKETVKEYTKITVSSTNIIDKILATGWFDNEVVDESVIQEILDYASNENPWYFMVNQLGVYGPVTDNEDFNASNTVFVRQQISWSDYAKKLLSTIEAKQNESFNNIR